MIVDQKEPPATTPTGMLQNLLPQLNEVELRLLYKKLKGLVKQAQGQRLMEESLANLDLSLIKEGK